MDQGSVAAQAVDELLSRGVVEIIGKDELHRKLLSGEKLRVKLGIDPTSPELHIGRAVTLLKLRDFQQLGHQVVFIVGDFTAVIGDTSDKDAERPMLSQELIEQNKKSYFEQVGKIIDLSKAELHYNSEWLSTLTYKEIGEQADLFSVADFIARDVIRRRLDLGKRVSLRETIYPLMQGYDSVAVRADVELGGTDQKFNLLAGRTMQEKYKQMPQSILIGPLIEGMDGRKMSSSWGNTIPLTIEANDMYGKVMRMRDEQISSYLELCTRVPMSEVLYMREQMAKGGLHPRDAKMRLAYEIVALYQGLEAASKAQEYFVSTFSEKNIPIDVPEIVLSKGATLEEALQSLGKSKSELRRLVAAGAVVDIDKELMFKDIHAVLTQTTTIRVGKHTFIRGVIR